MKKLFSMILMGVMFVTACTPKEGIEVREAWMNPASQNTNGAVYLVIHNYSEADDALMGASTEIAEAVELHRATVVNDVAKMEVLPSVPLSAGEDVEFAPGGLHIMLVNLREELKVGETIEITLHFQNSADISLSVPVQIGADHHEHDD